MHEKKRLQERLESAGTRVFDGVGHASFNGENSLILGTGGVSRRRSSCCASAATPAGWTFQAASSP